MGLIKDFRFLNRNYNLKLEILKDKRFKKIDFKFKL